MSSEIYYTYKGAAKRTGKSTNTIRRWVREGMPHAVDLRGRVVIEHRTLMRWYREKMAANPVHQARGRAFAKQEGARADA